MKSHDKALQSKAIHAKMGKEPRPGQRATMKSSRGGYMAYIPGKKKEGTEDSIRHGFGSKEEARSYSKNRSK